MNVKGVLLSLKGYEKTKLEKSGPQGKRRPPKEFGAGEGDSIKLSRQARLYSRVLRAAQESPDIRHKKVSELKALVESGRYHPDNKKTAAKIVEEDLDLII